MISALLRVSKQLSLFEGGQILPYNVFKMSFGDIAKKLNYHFLQLEVIIKNKVVAVKQKRNTASEDAKNCKNSKMAT